MATNNLSVSDLNDFANDAAEIITKVYNDYPVYYRIKDIILTDFSNSLRFSRPQVITIGPPNLPDGIQATATSKATRTGTYTYSLQIYVTNPGSGYTSPPIITVGTLSTPNINEIVFDGSSPNVVNISSDTITYTNHNFTTGQRVQYYDGGGLSNNIGGLISDNDYYIISVNANTIQLAASSNNAFSNTFIDLTSLGEGSFHLLSNNITRVTAVPVLEVDPILMAKREQVIQSINSQIIEESILVKVEALRRDLEKVLQEIRDEFDVNLTDNLASIIKNIDNSSNGLLFKSRYNITGVSGTFVLGEKVTSATASGTVVHFDDISNVVAIGYISGIFRNGQILTGETSSATGTLVIRNEGEDASNDQIARGMMILNLKTTNTLEDLKNEIRNPTRLLR
jgi:hypothetical protein